MSKHTPGPWAYEVSFDVDSKTDKLNLIGDGKILAQTITFVEHSESEANSKLILAAPMLLEALVISEHELRAFPKDKGAVEIALKNIRAAIKKATGES